MRKLRKSEPREITKDEAKSAQPCGCSVPVSQRVAIVSEEDQWGEERVDTTAEEEQGGRNMEAQTGLGRALMSP